MRLGDFTAHILVDGKPLDEYDVVSQSPTEATCWIASEEGKSFCVQWKCHEEERIKGSAGDVVVDGVRSGRTVMRLGPLGKDDTSSLSCFVGQKTERDFVFTKIQLTDDDSLLQKDIPKNLGQIRLLIQRGELVKLLRDMTPRHDGSIMLGDNKYHERAKKATTHCIGFGPARPRDHHQYDVNIVPNNEPGLIFVFNYQSLSILQANGIVPRPTVSNATLEDNEPSQLDDRIRDLENELKRLRDEKANDSEDRKPKRFKKEEEPDVRGVFVPGEVIDLT